MAKRTTSKPSKFDAEQISRIETAVLACVETHLPENFYLLDVAFEQEASFWYLRLYVEGRGFRVSLNDCEAVSRLLDEQIEALPLLKDVSYSLEVSSPGAFRALKKPREFDFYQGAVVKVQGSPTTKRPFKPVEGTLCAYDAEAATITLQVGEAQEVVALNADRAVYLNPELKFPDTENASESVPELNP